MDSNLYSVLLISNDANYGNVGEIYVYTNLIILLAALQKRQNVIDTIKLDAYENIYSRYDVINKRIILENV